MIYSFIINNWTIWDKTKCIEFRRQGAKVVQIWTNHFQLKENVCSMRCAYSMWLIKLSRIQNKQRNRMEETKPQILLISQEWIMNQMRGN